MNTPRDKALLIEKVANAWRPKDRQRVAYHPNWYDLADDERIEAFSATELQRKLEAAMDPEGLSTTAHAVLARIREAG